MQGPSHRFVVIISALLRCLFCAVQDPFEPDRDRTVVRLAEGALAISSIAGHRWQGVGI